MTRVESSVFSGSALRAASTDSSYRLNRLMICHFYTFPRVGVKTNLEFIFLEFGVRHDCNVGCPRLDICVEEASDTSWGEGEEEGVGKR